MSPTAEHREARWVGETGDRRLQGIVASPPREGKAAEADIVALAQLPFVKAVRRLVERHVKEPGWCLARPFVEGVKATFAIRSHFDLCVLHPQLRDAIELVRRCPEVSFILDHIGKPASRWHPRAVVEPNRGARHAAQRRLQDFRRGPPRPITRAGPTTRRAIHRPRHRVLRLRSLGLRSDWSVSELATRYADWVAVVDRVTTAPARRSFANSIATPRSASTGFEAKDAPP